MTPLDVTTLVVSFVVGVFVPWATEAITHSSAPVALKSLITIALSAVVGAVATVTIGDFDSWQAYVTAIGAAWVASMRGYFMGLADPVTRRTANTGIGRAGSHGKP